MNKVCLVVLDGIGHNPNRNDPGDAVRLADMKNFERAKREGISALIKASGPEVGLVDPKDAGNSEVGHNAIGAGQYLKQGLKLIDDQIESGEIFNNNTWHGLIDNSKKTKLHFIGMISHGRIHSDVSHLFAMLLKAKEDGVKDIYIHAVIDGRDVPPQSAKESLKELIDFIKTNKIPAKIADVGGRERIFMDRYFSRMDVVERTWRVYFKGEAPDCKDVFAALDAEYKSNPIFIDENLMPVMLDRNGIIKNGDSIVIFNYRGDRAIELADMIDNYKTFPEIKQYCDKCYFAAITQYEPDEKIPRKILVGPPKISNTLTDWLTGLKVKQFTVAETQKFGHLTYYFNGNRREKLVEELDERECVPSKPILFNEQPEMRAREICEILLKKFDDKSIDFWKANFANGDMVGHSGVLEATTEACRVVDECIGKIYEKCKKEKINLILVGDHGNAEEKFDSKGKRATKHTANLVPIVILDWKNKRKLRHGEFGLTNIASTICLLMGVEPNPVFNEPMIE